MSVKTTPGGQGSTPDQSKAASNFLAGVVGELKRTVWPTPQEGVRLTGVVLLVIAVFTLFLFIADLILTQIWNVLTPVTK